MSARCGPNGNMDRYYVLIIFSAAHKGPKHRQIVCAITILKSIGPWFKFQLIAGFFLWAFSHYNFGLVRFRSSLQNKKLGLSLLDFKVMKACIFIHLKAYSVDDIYIYIYIFFFFLVENIRF